MTSSRSAGGMLRWLVSEAGVAAVEEGQGPSSVTVRSVPSCGGWGSPSSSSSSARTVAGARGGSPAAEEEAAGWEEEASCCCSRRRFSRRSASSSSRCFSRTSRMAGFRPARREGTASQASSLPQSSGRRHSSRQG